MFLAGEGWQMVFESIYQPSQSSEVEHNPKMSISLFWLEMGFESIDRPSQSSEVECNPKMSISLFWLEMGFESIDQPGQSSEVERNTKTSISFLWLERGRRWGLSPLTSLSNHQKLNKIQKGAFHFFGCRAVADAVWVHQPARPIVRSWT